MLDRINTYYLCCFHSSWFCNVFRVLIVNARSFQALAAILDYMTHLVLMSCWYQSDARQDKFTLFQASLLWISKVQGYGHVCSTWSAKKNHKYQLWCNKAHWMPFSNLWVHVVYDTSFREIKSHLQFLKCMVKSYLMS